MTPQEEALIKAATDEFEAAAAQRGWTREKLAALSQPERDNLWNTYWTAKAAAEEEEAKKAPEGKKDDKDKAMAEEARKEHEKKEAMEREFAFARMYGEQMAYGFAQGQQKIAAAQNGTPAAAALPPAPSAIPAGTAKVASAQSGPSAFSIEAAKLASAMIANDLLTTHGDTPEANAAFAAWNEKIAAVVALPHVCPEDGPGVKSATAGLTFEQRQQVRALEIAEAAGYPVKWA